MLTNQDLMDNLDELAAEVDEEKVESDVAPVSSVADIIT